MKFGKIDGCGFGVKLVSFDHILNKGLLIYIYLKILKKIWYNSKKREKDKKEKSSTRVKHP
jgi:hypothetical protein